MRREVQLLRGWLRWLDDHVLRDGKDQRALPFVDLSVDRFSARAIGAGKAKRVYLLVGSLEEC